MRSFEITLPGYRGRFIAWVNSAGDLDYAEYYMSEGAPGVAIHAVPADSDVGRRLASILKAV